MTPSRITSRSAGQIAGHHGQAAGQVLEELERARRQLLAAAGAGRHDADVAAAKPRPRPIRRQPAGPFHALGDAQLARQLLELLAPGICALPTADHESGQRRELRQGPEQDLHALPRHQLAQVDGARGAGQP